MMLEKFTVWFLYQHIIRLEWPKNVPNKFSFALIWFRRNNVSIFCIFLQTPLIGTNYVLEISKFYTFLKVTLVNFELINRSKLVVYNLWTITSLKQLSKTRWMNAFKPARFPDNNFGEIYKILIDQMNLSGFSKIFKSKFLERPSFLTTLIWSLKIRRALSFPRTKFEELISSNLNLSQLRLIRKYKINLYHGSQIFNTLRKLKVSYNL